METLRKSPEEMEYILVTDVGSTTTKARLFHNREGEWRFLVSGEAPTTVESPYEDVTLGVRNTVREIEELTERQILFPDGSGIITSPDGEKGVDLYCTTSSAGGGLQMMVAGVITTMTAESANRAALGAGAIVMDVIAIDDGYEEHDRIKRIRNLRPDMILLAGGTDGGTVFHVVQLAETIKAAEPKPRLGISYKLPLVYAGNKYAFSNLENILEELALKHVDNIRPSLEVENMEPARRAIHELFMEHVMSHAPGYEKLMKWTNIEIMPTPAAEGLAIQLLAKTLNTNTLGVGLGGATTNIYSIFEGRFVRSVSANLGMSYSICNVLREAGIENIMRWLPFELEEEDCRSRLMNKMLRPTTIPQTLQELILEHAVAREALRLGLEHHKTIATRLKGVKVERDFASILGQALEETYIDMMNIEAVAGTGGLLSHAPDRAQAMTCLIDGLQPEGITMMFQDSVFMMPHLGILSTEYPDVAWQIFDKDCLIRLGTVIAPKGTTKTGNDAMIIKIEYLDGTTREENVKFGEIKRMPLTVGQKANAIIEPAKNLDVGGGPGRTVTGEITGGEVGIVLDGRGRPLYFPESNYAKTETTLNWFKSLNLYPAESLKALLET